VGGEDTRELFYRVRGGAGRQGIGEERAPAMVHHNGVEGGHFQSGIGRGVMGGRMCSGHYRSGRVRGAGWGRKTKVGGHVSARERGGLGRAGGGRGPRGVGEGWPAGLVAGEVGRGEEGGREAGGAGWAKGQVGR
jgi:hypothetical protein